MGGSLLWELVSWGVGSFEASYFNLSALEFVVYELVNLIWCFFSVFGYFEVDDSTYYEIAFKVSLMLFLWLIFREGYNLIGKGMILLFDFLADRFLEDSLYLLLVLKDEFSEDFSTESNLNYSWSASSSVYVLLFFFSGVLLLKFLLLLFIIEVDDF